MACLRMACLRMTRLRLYPSAQHTHEAQLRASGGKAFKAVLSGHAVQLERIQPAIEVTNTE